MKKYYNKTIVGLALVFIAGIFFFWQFSLQQNQISCGGDWSYSVRCPFGTYCRSIGRSPQAGGLCTPFLSFFKNSVDSDTVFPIPTRTTSPTVKPTTSPIPSKNQQKEIATKDPDLLYLRQINVTSGYEDIVFEFGPQKKAQATIRTTNYGKDFDYPYTQFYELASVQPRELEHINFFAASRTVNLENYLGQRKTVYYREVISLIMTEEQFVLIDKIE